MAPVAVVRSGMTDPQQPDAGPQERFSSIPQLESDETIAPRPEEEAADIARSTPTTPAPEGD
jgi:hypothetical protein